jgi:lysophospholipase L1-like esterase
MKALTLLALAVGLIAAAPAAADEPTEFPLHDVFVDVDPCTGLDHTVEITGTFFRHHHANGNTYHATRTITTSSGYVGHGVEVSVDHERIFALNDVLANPNGNRIRAKVVVVRDADFTTVRVERFRLECIGRAARAVAAAGSRSTAYPNAVAVIGDADATGYASDTKHPFQEDRANSWATGTNPSVRSIYSRLLAVNPSITGHAFNFASHGATLKDLPSQVRKAVARTIKPELVLVQIMENDITCDGKDDTRYTDYQARTTAALQTLAKGLPKARILAVSKWGTLDSYINAVQSYGMAARLTHAGKGPCSIFAPKTGKVVPEHVSYVRRMTNGYHAAFAAACAAVPTCRYDGGAARRIALRPADLAHRYEHLSVQGQAKLAAVEWKGLYGS